MASTFSLNGPYSFYGAYTYKAVLVFRCFKSVKSVEFCLSDLFQANALYWISSEGKIPQICYFWNIKMPKPPHISSRKIIGLLHFMKFLGPSERNYLWQHCRLNICRYIGCIDKYSTYGMLSATAKCSCWITTCKQNIWEKKKCVWTLRKNGGWRRGNKDSNSWFENTWKILNSARPLSVLR